jgi:cell division protein FtsW (lipid II flippase)
MPAEPSRRNRRTIDGVLVAATAVLAGLAAVVARSASDVDEEVGQAAGTVFGWAGGLWRATLLATLALALVILVDALVRRRWLLVRDLLLSLVLVNVIGSVLARVVDSD